MGVVVVDVFGDEATLVFWCRREVAKYGGGEVWSFEWDQIMMRWCHGLLPALQR